MGLCTSQYQPCAKDGCPYNRTWTYNHYSSVLHVQLPHQYHLAGAWHLYNQVFAYRCRSPDLAFSRHMTRSGQQGFTITMIMNTYSVRSLPTSCRYLTSKWYWCCMYRRATCWWTTQNPCYMLACCNKVTLWSAMQWSHFSSKHYFDVETWQHGMCIGCYWSTSAPAWVVAFTAHNHTVFMR